MGSMQQPAIGAFWDVRRHTERLCQDLTTEDQCIQSMPDASPAKWHRAHTTWFFEQFLLVPHLPGYTPFSADFSYLFNSYYEAVGARHPRFARGMITRPGVDQVTAYRQHVDEAMARLISSREEFADLLALGLQHEQQHQELLITDMLHGLAQNPLSPAMLPGWTPPPASDAADEFVAFPGGIVGVGHHSSGFAFDNEGPCHQALLAPYQLANRLVRNEAWLAFMADGGYTTPTLWMSEGWAAVLEQAWTAPLHWRQGDGGWLIFGPGGETPVRPDEPVRHISLV